MSTQTEKSRLYTYVVTIDKNSLVFHNSITGGFWSGEMTIQGSHNTRRCSLGNRQMQSLNDLNLKAGTPVEVWGPYSAKGGVFRIRTVRLPKNHNA